MQNVQKAFAAGAPRPTMHSLDRHLASNVCCRKENSFRDCHCIGHDASANNSNSTRSVIAQKLKKAIFSGKFQWIIPVNRHYYSLVTENVDSMWQTKTAGRGLSCLRPGGLKGWGEWSGGVDDPDQTKQGGSLHFGLKGDRRPCL